MSLPPTAHGSAAAIQKKLLDVVSVRAVALGQRLSDGDDLLHEGFVPATGR